MSIYTTYLKSFWSSDFDNIDKLSLLVEYSDVVIFGRNFTRYVRDKRRKAFDKKKEWIELDSKCWTCDKRPEVRHHIIALKNGGGNSRRNIISLCRRCHSLIHPWLQ